jgi:exopolyphosphatase/guanosine-5'-triphosphate,3'-diphosphate pyrophosphatase
LIRDGVAQNLSLTDEPVLIMDIGGGSTEFIIADQQRTYWKRSFDIGASRLLEVFSPADPIRPSQIKQLQAHILHEIASLEEAIKKYPVNILVGASGSSESYARMIGHRESGKDPLRGKANYEFNLASYFDLHSDLLRSTRKDRTAMKGLVRMRVDMIVLASITTELVLKQFGFKKMLLSTYALKEGAAFRIAKGVPLP